MITVQLNRFFPEVECERQENDLIVDNADAVYDYVYSCLFRGKF